MCIFYDEYNVEWKWCFKIIYWIRYVMLYYVYKINKIIILNIYFLIFKIGIILHFIVSYFKK